MIEFLDALATLDASQLDVVVKGAAAAFLVGMIAGAWIVLMWGQVARAGTGLLVIVALCGGAIYLLAQSRAERVAAPAQIATSNQLAQPTGTTTTPVAVRNAGKWWE